MQMNNLGDMGWKMSDLLHLVGDNADIRWNDPEIDYFLRIRYVGDYIPQMRCTILDLSYAFAYTKDGQLHRVVQSLPYQISTKGHDSILKAVKAAIIQAAKDDHVFAKGVKALDDDVLSIQT